MASHGSRDFGTGDVANSWLSLAVSRLPHMRALHVPEGAIQNARNQARKSRVELHADLA